MIVECSECQTRFQLDDTRVPASGIRVRCSRCKHAFFLKPPGAESADAIHEVAEEAAVAEQVPAPGGTQDLPGPTSVPAEEDEESDWEFNQEIPDSGSVEDPESDLGEAGDDSIPLDDGESDFAADEDFRADEDFGADDLEHDSLADPNALGESGLDLGGDDEPDVAETPAIASAEPAGSAPMAAEEDDAFGSVDELGDLGSDAESAISGEGATADGFEDPEDWDFFGDEGPPAHFADPSAGPVSSSVVPPASAGAPLLEPAGLDTMPVADARDGVFGPVLRGIGHGVGWIVVLALLGLGLVHGIEPSWREAAVREPLPLANGLRPDAVEAHWIESAMLGPLLVVSGTLEGPARGPAVAVGAVELSLLDADGRPLDVEAAVVGAPVPTPALREWDRSSLGRVRAAAARALSASQVGPGQRLAFQAVVADVPVEAQRFDLRAVPAETASGGNGAVDAVADATAGSMEDPIQADGGEAGNPAAVEAPRTGTPPR